MPTQNPDALQSDILRHRSVLTFVLLEFALSVPFWGIGALAQAHVIPDQVMFRAAWSLTPMIAASILVYRENRVAGVKQLFRRIVDYRRIKSKIWYLPVFLAGPFIVFVQYGLARWSGLPVPPPHLTLLVPLSFVGFFLIAYAEELGWTVYVLDTLQEKRSALTAGFWQVSCGRHCMPPSGHWPASLWRGAPGSGSMSSHSGC